MTWLYRLQQHIGLTPAESRVLLALSFLFLTGLVASYYQAHTPPAAPDARFAAAGAMPAVAGTGERPATGGMAPAEARMNLNTATAAELERLPRIGPRMAARILAYRQAHGSFARVDDLVRVRGIGPKTLARIAPYLFVEQAPAP